MNELQRENFKWETEILNNYYYTFLTYVKKNFEISANLTQNWWLQ